MSTSTVKRARWARWLLGAIVLVALLLAVFAGWVAWSNVRGEAPLDGAAAPTTPPDAKQVQRGAYLARAGNCMGCHTTVGGAEFAGGSGVHTPFGTVFAPNITPDAKTGIGAWSAAEFWRAMHHGRSKDGRLLYPAFPYPSYTKVTREDSDALYAYLRTVKPVEQPNKAHQLPFPYGTQPALAVWRALFFRPGAFESDPQQDAGWNRGKYLVDALAHCAACHSSRNALGATSVNAEFAGGLMPDQTWYAPSLATPKEAGVQGWPREEVVKLLKDGVSAHATVSGPMAEVVFTSTQYLSAEDLGAMAQYLAAIPVREEPRQPVRRAGSDVMERGGKVYGQQCAGCHGARGEGVPSIYPALAGNRGVLLDAPNNLIQLVRHGGFSPSTAGNPRPFGMPPFHQVLGDEDIAAVITYVRQSWGNQAAPVSPFDVQRVR
jgi:mono/diheme cytochrome c family protein